MPAQLTVLGLLVVLPVLGAFSCSSGSGSTSPSTSTSVARPPCGDGAARVELGFPLQGGPTAAFTTKGGDLYITARRFEHGGPFDPAQGSTQVFIGPQETPPTYDERRNTVSNTLAQVRVKENEFSTFELPPGRYWVWTSNGGDLLVVSCVDGGVSDPSPYTAKP